MTVKRVVMEQGPQWNKGSRWSKVRYGDSPHDQDKERMGDSQHDRDKELNGDTGCDEDKGHNHDTGFTCSPNMFVTARSSCT